MEGNENENVTLVKQHSLHNVSSSITIPSPFQHTTLFLQGGQEVLQANFLTKPYILRGLMGQVPVKPPCIDKTFAVNWGFYGNGMHGI